MSTCHLLAKRFMCFSVDCNYKNRAKVFNRESDEIWEIGNIDALYIDPANL